MNMTPKQISDAAHTMSDNARNTEQHLAAAEAHENAAVNGHPPYKFGHIRQAEIERAKAARPAGTAARRNLERSLDRAAQIGL